LQWHLESPDQRGFYFMTYLDAIILGIVQGLTEFLPVSSSAHLVFAQFLLGVKEPGITLEIVVHIGTLIAVILYYRQKLWALMLALFDRAKTEERRIILYLVIGTIPAGLAGIFLNDFFESSFSDPRTTAASLIISGFLLLFVRLAKPTSEKVSLFHAITMGIGQAISILPGISRSGATISMGMYTGLDAVKAAEFSFLLSIPAITGAIIFKTDALVAVDSLHIGPYLVGALFAFVFGLLSVAGLLKIVQKGKFEYFAYYCFAVGAFGLYYFW